MNANRYNLTQLHSTLWKMNATAIPMNWKKVECANGASQLSAYKPVNRAWKKKNVISLNFSLNNLNLLKLSISQIALQTPQAAEMT